MDILIMIIHFIAVVLVFVVLIYGVYHQFLEQSDKHKQRLADKKAYLEEQAKA